MLADRSACDDLAVSVFTRAIHPELVTVVRRRTRTWCDGTLRLNVTSSGHLLEFRRAGLTLTEVCGPAAMPLPRRGRIDGRPCADARECRLVLPGGGIYVRQTRVRTYDPPQFWRRHGAIVHHPAPGGLLELFDPAEVDGPGAIARLRVASRPRRLVVEALHTFPDRMTIVRCRSMLMLATDPETSLAPEEARG